MLVPQLHNPQHLWLILRLKRFDSFLNNLHRLQEIYIGVTFNFKGRLSKDKNYVNSDICFKMYKNTKYSDMVINIYNVQVTVYKDTQLLSNSLLNLAKLTNLISTPSLLEDYPNQIMETILVLLETILELVLTLCQFQVILKMG